MTVLEVEPGSVRVLSGGSGQGACSAMDPALVQAALDWVEDPVGLYRDRPVKVADLWRATIVSAAGERCDRLVVVHPDDWPPHRVDRVLAAANTVADDVTAVRRSAWPATGRTAKRACGPDARSRRPDAPDARSRRRAVPMTVGAVLPVRAVTLVVVVTLVALVTLVVVVAVVVATRPVPRSAALDGASRAEVPRTVADGRVAIDVPADWALTRVTAGPGSRRLQVTSPDDPATALHVTQTYAPESTLAQAAELFARAIAGQPAFVGLRADAQVAGRPAVAYREVRPGRFIDWTVVLAGATRISVGCQSRPGNEQAVRAACEAAVGSAREIGTDSRRGTS